MLYVFCSDKLSFWVISEISEYHKNMKKKTPRNFNTKNVLKALNYEEQMTHCQACTFTASHDTNM